MLEKYLKLIMDLKKKNDKELMLSKLETVQGFFEMQDRNKMLKFNAITQKQLDSANRFEEHLQAILEKLYVPDYQSQNI